MRKIWLIAENTYRPGVRTGSFLFLTLVIPIIMVAAGLIGYLFFGGQSGLETVGYVDQTGQMPLPDRVETDSVALNMVRFEDLDQAQAAYADGRIDAYLLVPAGYFEGEPVAVHAEEPPGAEALQALERFIRMGLLPGAPGELLDRIEDPAQFTIVASSTGAEITSEAGLVARFITPMLLAVLFSLAVAFMTSQLGSAVLREKESRAMEIVITSLRAGELVAGKVLGMTLLAVTQFAIWIAGGVIAVLLFTSGGRDLPDIVLPWDAILWGLLLIPPGYLLYAVLSSGAGIIAGESQQAQQLAGLLGLFAFVPLWFTPIWVNDPNGSAAVFFTLFPLSAPTSALFRMAFATVPTWQLLASFAILVLSLLLATVAVGRIFRAAMLVYGKTASARLVWQSLWQG
jgi:ABC-2 type transport system permease protein